MIESHMKNLLFMLIVIFSVPGLSAAGNSDHGAAGNEIDSDTRAAARIYLGIEYAELAQNGFRDLGPDNFTCATGQRFQSSGFEKYGWRFMAIKAELSAEHLGDPDQVAFIEGNREDLSGDVLALRAYWDYYPFTLNLGWSGVLDAPVLSVAPVLSGGIGYNSWGFTNTAYDEEYRLNAMTVSAGACLHTELFGILFIENPLLDFFLYTVKNRAVQGEIGDTSITRPEVWGLFSWATAGIIIRL